MLPRNEIFQASTSKQGWLEQPERCLHATNCFGAQQQVSDAANLLSSPRQHPSPIHPSSKFKAQSKLVQAQARRSVLNRQARRTLERQACNRLTAGANVLVKSKMMFLKPQQAAVANFKKPVSWVLYLDFNARYSAARTLPNAQRPLQDGCPARRNAARPSWLHDTCLSGLNWKSNSKKVSYLLLVATTFPRRYTTTWSLGRRPAKSLRPSLACM